MTGYVLGLPTGLAHTVSEVKSQPDDSSYVRFIVIANELHIYFRQMIQSYEYSPLFSVFIRVAVRRILDHSIFCLVYVPVSLSSVTHQFTLTPRRLSFLSSVDTRPQPLRLP